MAVFASRKHCISDLLGQRISPEMMGDHKAFGVNIIECQRTRDYKRTPRHPGKKVKGQEKLK